MQEACTARLHDSREPDVALGSRPHDPHSIACTEAGARARDGNKRDAGACPWTWTLHDAKYTSPGERLHNDGEPHVGAGQRGAVGQRPRGAARHRGLRRVQYHRGLPAAPVPSGRGAAQLHCLRSSCSTPPGML